MTARETAREAAVSAAFRVAWASVHYLPDPLVRRAFDAAADASVRRRGPAVVQLARNLRRVLGPRATPESLHEVVRAGMRSYARYWRETFQLPSMDLARVAKDFESGATGLNHIDDAVGQGRGVIVALSHSGSWDAAGLMISRRYGGMTTVVERIAPEGLYERFTRYRELLGMEVLPLSGPGAERTTATLKERLGQGRVVCLVADRDLNGRGVPVTFFGEAARMPAGPAMMAALTGAALCPSHSLFIGDGWGATITAPVDLVGARLSERVRGATQQLADFYAGQIAAAPADWHMLQPLWDVDRPPRGSSGAGDERLAP